MDRTLHQAHDFEVASTARMHNHFQQCNGGDSDILKVIWVLLPWFGVVLGFLLGGGVVVEGIAGGVEEFDII